MGNIELPKTGFRANFANHFPVNISLGTSLVAQTVKNLPANAGYPGSIPGSGRFPGEGTENPLQYSCLEKSTDRGAWWATVHAVTESDTTELLTLPHT